MVKFHPAAMKLAAITVLVYALMVSAGGLVGYVQAKSIPSLISGILSGIVLLICGWLVWQGSMAAGYTSGAVVLLLALFFGYRFVTTNKFMPGGMMLILSFIALFFLLLGLFLKAKP